MFKFTKNQRFSHPILGGLLSALLFSFLWRLIGDFSAIASLVPLFAVGLMNRQRKNLVASLVAAFLGISLFLGFEHLLNYALYVGFPGLIFPYLAMGYKLEKKNKVWYPLERLAGMLGLYALGSTLVLMVVWHFFGTGEKAFMTLESSLKKGSFEAQDQITLLITYLELLWPYIPGLTMGVFVLMLSLSTSLTPKWFQIHKIKNPRPPLMLSDLYLPWWCWKVFATLGVSLAVAWQLQMPSLKHLFGNMIAPLLALFILQGLSIVLVFAKKQKNTQMFLVIFYGFVLVFGWTLLILILVGLLEPWLDLRTRLTQKKEKE